MKDKDKLPKSQVFNGKKYKLIWKAPKRKNKRSKPDHGQCAPPTWADRVRTIYVNPDESPQAVCDTIIHEGLHAELWDLDEEAVTRIANNITNLLDKCGLIVKQD